jgi:hypothetical protein
MGDMVACGIVLTLENRDNDRQDFGIHDQLWMRRTIAGVLDLACGCLWTMYHACWLYLPLDRLCTLLDPAGDILVVVVVVVVA